MKIVFIQTVPFEMIGIQMLASVLKEHDLQVIITYMDSRDKILRKLRAFKPDFICFSCATSDHHQLLDLAKWLKKEFAVPFIWGGPHATFFPEIIRNEGVDIVVRGEAECILPALIDAPQDTSRKSCNFKMADGEIVRNPMGSLISDLDALPFPDRSLYRKFYKGLPYSSLTLINGRGCPFNCSFCYNRALKKMFKDDVSAGNYVRLRSPSRVIEEIEGYVEEFGRPRNVMILDDTLIFNRKWIMEFLDLYKKRLRIPFVCLGRADLVDEELVIAMKEAGISCFMFAVETGNESIRNGILNKNVTDEQILNCGELLNRHKIQFRAYNMMGVPTETWQDALLTVDINRKIKNPLPLCTIYDPYPDTELATVAVESQLLSRPITSDSFGKIQYASSLLNLDPRIIRIQMLFFYFVKFPFLDRFLRRWIESDHGIMNRLLFFPAYGYVFWRSYKYTISEMLLIIWRTAMPLMGMKADRGVTAGEDEPAD